VAVPCRGVRKAHAGMAADRPLTRQNRTSPGTVDAAPHGEAATPSTTPATPQGPKAALAASVTPAGGKRNEAPDGRLNSAEKRLASAKTTAVPTSWRAREVNRGIFTRNDSSPSVPVPSIGVSWGVLLYPSLDPVKRRVRPVGSPPPEPRWLFWTNSRH